MNKLIIVAGASGAGKSFLLQQMSEIDPSIVPIKKLSTRKPRAYEKKPSAQVDLIFECSLRKIQAECQFIYRYESETYGIRKSDIDAALAKGRIPFVIVRDCEEIIALKKEYNKTLTLYLQSGYSGQDLAAVLRRQGRDEIDIETRDARSRKDYEQYRDYFKQFDYVLINYFEGDPLIEHFKKILSYEKYRDPTKHKDVFVLMSFSPDMTDIYEEIKIAATLHDTKINVHRIDDEPGAFTISDEILKKIRQAELVICDLTQERPNVYYELGYATAESKPLILTAKTGTKLHFDIQNYRVIFYDSTTDLRNKLKREFEHFYK